MDRIQYLLNVHITGSIHNDSDKFIKRKLQQNKGKNKDLQTIKTDI